MKRLFLVRHAKSSWDHPGLADHARPLADRGVRDARRMFARLLDYGPRFDAVVTSDAKRALATADFLIDAIGSKNLRVVEEPRLYHASVATIVEIARGQSDQLATIACVGHNPGFTDTANALIEDLTLDNLPTCGIIGMELGIDQWSAVTPGRAQLIYIDYPKNTAHPVVRPTNGSGR